MNLSEENIDRCVDEIVARAGTQAASVIPILQEIQRTFRFLPERALQRVCEITEITPSQITGISTFYTQFRHRPAGKHTIRVCTGTACHVKGAGLLLEAFQRELKLDDHRDTDEAGLFTLEGVACLGCCTLAPVVRIDDITYGHVKPDKIREILEDFLTRQSSLDAGQHDSAIPDDHFQGEIRIGLGSCCMASGSQAVKDELEKTLHENHIHLNVKEVGCIGVCNQVPVLEIIQPGNETAVYTKIRPEEVRHVILKHFQSSEKYYRLKTRLSGVFERIMENGAVNQYRQYRWDEENTPLKGFLGPQMNIATENRGEHRPCDLVEYMANGGFESLKHCLAQGSPQWVIDEILSSCLRGRGGGGFSSGKKWQLVKNQADAVKYVICNGDEGDPGAFMDRMLLESYPFRIIEGMMIAGFATGAGEGIFYIRAEYPLAVERINEALSLCRQQGILGKSVFNSAFSFDIRIFEGAGAFICGEETALIASIEGKRGHPRMRPPFPAISGLWGRPTLINNVETFSLVSWIVRHGANSFSSIGTTTSKGTKVFALAGKVNRGGLIEVPMGISMGQIVHEIGGGIQNGKKFKAVQIGGPSGGCLPASMSDITVDYEEITRAGAMMGSGGLIVLDETDCMVDLAHYFLTFTQAQSCGRCTFCRIGTLRILELLTKIRNGEASEEDLTSLEELAHTTSKGSLCGLGKTAPNPVLTTLKYFRHEYEAHVRGVCPAGKCKPLIRYYINELCIGCTKCAQQCPTGAIEFKPYEIHQVNQEKCIKCDICRECCPTQAVLIQ